MGQEGRWAESAAVGGVTPALGRQETVAPLTRSFRFQVDAVTGPATCYTVAQRRMDRLHSGGRFREVLDR